MGYVSYFSFFGQIKQIVHDAALDFKLYGQSAGADLPARYDLFVKKLSARCNAYAKSCIMGRSEMVSQYLSEIMSVSNYDISVRFDKLLSITDMYVRKCV